MAETEAIFKLRVDTGNSVNDVENLTSAVKETQTATEGKGVTDFEKKLDALDKKLAEGNLTFRQRSRLIKEYQAIALQAGDATPVGDRAVRSAAALTDELGDLNQRVRLLSSDFVGMDTALAGIETGAAAFQGVQSAIALTGVENEKLIESMQKLQAVQGVVNAIMIIRRNLNKDEILGIQLSAAAEKIRTFVLGTSTTQTIALTTAQKALRVALLATGAGIVLAGIAALYLAYEKWSTQQKKVAENNKLLAEQAKEQRESIAKESASFGTLIARLKATNEGSKERKDLIKQINKEYGTTLKNLSDEAEFQNQLNNELKNYLEFQRQKYQLQKNEDLISRNLAKQDELQAKIVQKQKELNQAAKEAVELRQAGAVIDESDTAIPRLKEDLKTLRNELQQAEKRFENYGGAANKASGAIDQLTNNGKKYVEQQNIVQKVAEGFSLTWEQLQEMFRKEDAERAEATKKVNDYISGLLNESEQDALKRFEKEIAEEERREQKRLDLIRAYNEVVMTEYQLDALEFQENQQKKSHDLAAAFYNNLITQQQYDEALKALLKEQAEFEVDLEKRKQEAIKAERDKAFQEQVQQIEKVIGITQQFVGVTNALNGLLNASDQERLKQVKGNAVEEEKIKRRMFERDKKQRIAQTAIDTATNVVRSVANGGGIPAGIPFGIAAGAMGALQIAAISKQTFDGTSGGGSFNAPPPSTQAPVTTANETNPNNTTNNLPKMTKVVVVENDITRMQKKVQVTESLSGF